MFEVGTQGSLCVASVARDLIEKGIEQRGRHSGDALAVDLGTINGIDAPGTEGLKLFFDIG